MIDLFLVFWTLMIFLSIAWYGFLLFYVGFKGGKEIRILTKTLGGRSQLQKPPNSRLGQNHGGTES